MMNDNDVAIDIESANRSLAESIRNRIQSHPLSKSCIYRVPEKLRSKAEAEYVPKILAIGPYHRDNANLKSMEDDKRWYLHAFLSRRERGMSSLPEEAVGVIRDLEKAARECYADPNVREISSDDFVRMMIFDGCFILELLCRWHDYKRKRRFDARNDRLFTNTCMIPRLRRDLLLLENQIPFIVLEALFNLVTERLWEYDINDIIKSFFNDVLPTVNPVEGKEARTKGKHLLDLLRSYLLPSNHHELSSALKFYDWEHTKCAIDISEAGVKFKTREGGDGLLDLNFDDKYGVLEIPPFRFGESVTVLLRNLIALEQCQGHLHLITSYVILLHGLIKSTDDVKLLRSMIIDKFYIDDRRVVAEINNLRKGVVVNEFYYDLLCLEVNDYCRIEWRKWRAIWKRDYLKTLKRDYCNTPWKVLSCTAAVILLLLTFTQTLYSVLSYYPN